MMKRAIILLAMFIALSFAAPQMSAADCNIDGIYYYLNKDKQTAKVTCHSFFQDPYKGAIVIPEYVVYENETYTVTGISYAAFANCSELISVTIPRSIECIDQDAFKNCIKLSTVYFNAENCKEMGMYMYPVFDNCPKFSELKFGDNVRSIPSSGFESCTGLKNIVLPDSLTYMGFGCFLNCTGLTSVTYGKKMTYTGYYAFDGCTNLKTVRLTNAIKSITSNSFSGCISLSSISLPPGVTYIEQEAFSMCKALSSINIPDLVETIDEYAFSGCSGLTAITFPRSIKRIGKYAFWGCTGLASIIIPGSVNSIGDGGFWGCTGLTSITIPSSVNSIGSNPFSWCSGLISINVESGNRTYDSRGNCNAIIDTQKNVLIAGCRNTVIPSDVSYIGNFAFSGCKELASAVIPNSVTSIGNYAFSGCSGLTNINIPNSVTSIGGNAFSGCSGLTNVNIPNSVTSIGGSAFSGCSGLTRVYISNSVETIASETFKDCSSLATVTIPNSVTTIGRNAFYGTALTSIVLGSSVNKIEDYAFSTKSTHELDRVVCTAVAPPLCGNRVFNKSSKARLFVPAESIERYKKANVWSYFQIISDCSGVSDVGADDAEVMYDVYDMRGVRVAGGLRETEANAERLPRGVYILVSPQGRKKLKI